MAVFCAITEIESVFIKFLMSQDWKNLNCGIFLFSGMKQTAKLWAYIAYKTIYQAILAVAMMDFELKVPGSNIKK